jgi:hypothetical protein
VEDVTIADTNVENVAVAYATVEERHFSAA